MVTNNSANYSPTQYNLQTGGASGALNNVAPSATSGVPAIGNGSSSQPTFGTMLVGGGGTGLTSATAYAPICAGTTSTGNFQYADTGLSTAGNVLTSNGSSALPTWQAAPGGGSWIQLNKQTASTSSTLTFTSTYITTTYRTYMVIMENILSSGSSGSFRAQVSTDNGSTYVTTGYSAGLLYFVYNNAGGTFSNVNSSTYFDLFEGSTAKTTGTFFFYNLKSAGVSPVILGDSWAQNLYWQKTIGYNSTTTAVNNIKFFFGAGTITSGSLTLYGLTP